jgi:acylphosphatase
MTAPVLRLSETPGSVRYPGRRLGQDTRGVLCETGRTDDQIDRFVQAGAAVCEPGAMRRRVVAHGRVQGVFFRESLRRLAAELGVAGYARNLPDGTLQAVFEGPDDAVRRMVEFAHAGPPDADVERLEVMEESPAGLTGFTVT